MGIIMDTKYRKRQIPGSLALSAPGSEIKLDARKVEAKSIIPSLVLQERDVNRRLRLNEAVKCKELGNRRSAKANGENVDEQENGLLKSGRTNNPDERFRTKRNKRKPQSRDSGESKMQKIRLAVEAKARRRPVNVEIAPFNAPLAEGRHPLIIEGCARSPERFAAPFFSLPEFDPVSATDEMMMVEILNYEMEHLDEKMQKVRTVKEIFNFKLFEFFHRGQLCIQDYLNKFPWDRFYDPELYAAALKEHRGKIGLGCGNENIDIIAGMKRDKAGIRTPKKEYAFVPRR